jgi:hypothetical protein
MSFPHKTTKPVSPADSIENYRNSRGRSSSRRETGILSNYISLHHPYTIGIVTLPPNTCPVKFIILPFICIFRQLQQANFIVIMGTP